MSDVAQFAAICSAITGVVSVLVTLLCTKGVEAWRNVRGVKLEEKKYTDQREDSATQLLVKNLSEEVSQTRTEVRELRAGYEAKLDTMRTAHTQCEVKTAALEATNKRMEAEMVRMYEQGGEIQKWLRHELPNQLQVMLLQILAELKPEIQKTQALAQAAQPQPATA
jgi:hypothetical protein